ncbi:ribonuclease J [Pelagibacterium montanilacus]|uniref:ribonuclease J n=1 Tax=Pelagibacterium montanilacus TaxID=2185280 RepID=UPI000F8C3D97|nr:ribonuclease J [Pelagibacterium montanilacus]
MAGTDNKDAELVFVPLGGVGEIGMNMGLYGFGPAHDRQWLVVDCGVTFGGPDLPGIELIMPDTRFLEEEADRIVGLVITHAHEDHYGAVLDLWPTFDKPVYASRFCEAMLKAKRASNGIVDDVDVTVFTPGVPFSLGDFTVEVIPMSHSAPETGALLIDTPAGRVLHTADWKIDHGPVGTPMTDIERLKALGAEGKPLAVIGDSTNAMKEGVSPSESDIADNLAALIARAPHRVAVTIFASNLGRMISIARAAAKADRQVVAAGRAIHRVAGIARELGMMEGIPPFLDQNEYGYLPREKVVLLCTGSQGESRAAMARIAAGTHPVIDLSPGDWAVFSSWAIPGNEKGVLDIQNALVDKGVKIITNADEVVHVSGHPRRSELAQLYDWVKPHLLVPVHGEPMHLEAHAKFAREQGIGKVFSIRNGDMLRLYPEPAHFPGEVPVGVLYLDGNLLCTPEESRVRDRRRLALGGLVVISLAVNGAGQIVSGPMFDLDGLPELEDDEDPLLDVVKDAANGAFKSMPGKRRGDTGRLAEAIRRAVRSEVNAVWGRKPIVKVTVHKV